MATIQLDISDELLKEIGLASIQAHLQKQVDLMRTEHLAEKLGQTISQSGIDWDKELEEARQKAWQRYKIRY